MPMIFLLEKRSPIKPAIGTSNPVCPDEGRSNQPKLTVRQLQFRFNQGQVNTEDLPVGLVEKKSEP